MDNERHMKRTAEKEDRIKTGMNRHQSVYLNTIFLLLIFGFTAATLLHQQREKSETENRPLQQRPGLTWSSLISGEFAKKYEDYLSDQFVGRDGWITLKTGFERAMLKQESEDVYFAKDDYLIEAHTGVFTTDKAEHNIQTLGAFFAQLSERYDPAHLTCIVAPNAVDILRDKLPAFAQPYDEEAYLSKIRDALPEGVWLDSSEVLRAYRDEAAEDGTKNEVYYRTDHHWKTGAAYAVYRAWLEQKGLNAAAEPSYTAAVVSDTFEGTIASRLGIAGRADTIERYDPDKPFDYYLVYNQTDDIRNSVFQESHLATKDQYACFYGGNFGLIEAFMPEAGTGRKLLIIKDSYSHCFAPFTYAQFDEVDMVDPRYYNASIKELMEAKDYTDVLFLFNAAGFAEESAIARLLA